MDESAPMTNDARTRTANGSVWRSLFTAARVVAAVAVGVIAVLALAGRLTWVEAVVASAVVLAGAAVAGRIDTPVRRETERNAGGAVLDPAVERFAGTLSEPCIVVDERSVVVFCNPAAQAKLPRLRTGDPLAFTVRDPDVIDAIARARASGQPQFAEMQRAVPNEIWFRVSVVPFSPGPPETQLLVLSLYDLTEQRRTDQLRADFVANASHELRTPLTSLMGFIETLQGPAARDETARARFLTIMRGQSERMSALIDDLLSLSRIEQRQHVRPTAKVTLNSLLREVVEVMEIRAQDEGLAIDLVLPPEDLVVIGERQELYEVFENLLDNALKYGGGGKSVEITLDADGGARGRDAHRVTIIDHGPGIAEEHVPRLTERFYRVEGETSRRKKGTGLGLAIVKHIVARHHGQLTIRSQLGEGTRVEVLLPKA